MASQCSSSLSSFPFILLLLPLLLHLIHVESSAKGGDCYINALYNFGDSFSDTGNIARESPLGIVYARLPYGLTIHEPTGRPSDGLLMIDYVASALGLPPLPPYLDKNASFDHGVNFAVAGAAALDSSFFLSKNITGLFTNSSLGVQLHWFNHYRSSLCSSKLDCAKKFERSLFVVGEIGANDINYALNIGNKSYEEVKTYLPFMINQTIHVIKELIEVGARHLVIPGNLPLGCSPMYLTILGTNISEAYDENSCFIAYNDLPQLYNVYLKKALHNLRKQLPHVDIMYADFYNAFIRLLKKADYYGFDKETLRKGCCGVGGPYNFDPKRLCGTTLEATVCRNPSSYISWDGIHLTQAAYKAMAREVLSRGLIGPHDEPWKGWICAGPF